MMKTSYILPVLFAGAAVVTSAQVLAGMTYDPYENYYGEYYETSRESVVAQANVEAMASAEDTRTDAYRAVGNDNIDEATSAASGDVTDPSNYYNW